MYTSLKLDFTLFNLFSVLQIIFMYNSMTSPYCYKPNYLSSNYNSLSSYNNLDYGVHNNQYYNTKIMDDHRFQRKILQRPAFLIKQKSIYPEQNDYDKIGSALDYADKLISPVSHKFYGEQKEQQRLLLDGKNPFHQYSTLLQQKMNYLKKSSRSGKSRLSTNPNLGVRSYEFLQQNQNNQGYQLLNSRRTNNQQFQTMNRKEKQEGIQDYITKSILENDFKKKNQNSNIKQEKNSDDEMFYDNPENKKIISVVRKLGETRSPVAFVSKVNVPNQITYNGKKFIKIF